MGVNSLKCPACHGTGIESGFGDCLYCQGKGGVSADPSDYRQCDECNDIGYLLYGAKQELLADVVERQDKSYPGPGPAVELVALDKDGNEIEAEIGECIYCAGRGLIAKAGNDA